MDHSFASAEARVSRTLDVEMRLVQEAIALVAGGGSRRVVLGGIRFGEELLQRQLELATRSGVRLVPLWSLDDSGADIAVERVAGD